MDNKIDDVCELMKGRRQDILCSVDTSKLREVTGTFLASWEGIGYLVNWREIGLIEGGEWERVTGTLKHWMECNSGNCNSPESEQKRDGNTAVYGVIKVSSKEAQRFHTPSRHSRAAMAAIMLEYGGHRLYVDDSGL
ncbi:hypothetical protein EVAR_2955_1 [Eumeta japonica]|uniref:Uncharacterized protein n=1 Tax=Eumeta variegata TaxID=151549 RepID=A0A4C1T0X3_EUMVA|nr:hypothetical protein EVAR_2955_1 [Eumeta japonica]